MQGRRSGIRLMVRAILKTPLTAGGWQGCCAAPLLPARHGDAGGPWVAWRARPADHTWRRNFRAPRLGERAVRPGMEFRFSARDQQQGRPRLRAPQFWRRAGTSDSSATKSPASTKTSGTPFLAPLPASVYRVAPSKAPSKGACGGCYWRFAVSVGGRSWCAAHRLTMSARNKGDQLFFLGQSSGPPRPMSPYSAGPVLRRAAPPR